MRRESSVAVLLGLAIVLSLALDIAHADKEASPGADVMQIRALLERRQFVQLTALLKSYQARCEKDIRWELTVLDGFNVFAVAQPAYKDLLDEWVQSAPQSWVPLLARANYFISQGWRARGRKLAKDTSPEQFRRMEESFRLALPDIEAALRSNARLFYAYLLLMRINRSAGNQERGAVLVQKTPKSLPILIWYGPTIWFSCHPAGADRTKPCRSSPSSRCSMRPRTLSSGPWWAWCGQIRRTQSVKTRRRRSPWARRP